MLCELSRKRKRSKTTALKMHSKCSMRDYPFLITLILSGDKSLNPGPVKNPCSVCFGPVARNHKAVSCDNYVKWTHIKFEGINPRRYKAMVKIIKAGGNFTYVCKPCISSQLPFYCLDEDEFFDTLGINVPEDDKVYSYTEADFTFLNGKKFTSEHKWPLNKVDHMKILAQEIKFDILCLNETKLDARIDEDDICITGYTSYRRDRNRFRGGVIIYVADSLRVIPH